MKIKDTILAIFTVCILVCVAAGIGVTCYVIREAINLHVEELRIENERAKLEIMKSRLKEASQELGKTMRNKFSGLCVRCGCFVDEGKGYFEKVSLDKNAKLHRGVTNKWVVRCVKCVGKGHTKVLRSR